MDTRKSFDLIGQVRNHPYRALLLATGVGYVLGGGLFTRLTYNVLRAGLRVASIPAIQGEIIGFAVGAMAHANGTISASDNNQQEGRVS
jgi:hypothetical protein